MSGDIVRPGRSGPPRRTLTLGAVAVVAVVYGLVALFGGGRVLASWAPVIAAAFASASLYYAVRRRPRPGGTRSVVRDAWRWFGGAAAFWCAGATINAISRIVLARGFASLSLGDLFYLAAMAALATGFIVPIRLPRSARVWVRYAADTYVCAGSLFVLGWVVLFSQLYADSGESAPEFFIELLYPLVDGILVCALLPFVLGTKAGQRRSAWLAYVALLGLTAADVVTTAVRLRGGTVPGDPGDVIRFFALLLLGAAPWTESWVAQRFGPEAAELDGEDIADIEDLDRLEGIEPPDDGEDAQGTMIGPGIATAVASGAAAFFVAGHSLTAGHSLEPVVSVVAGTALLVVLFRLADLLRENERLHRAVGTGEEHFKALAESLDDVVVICDLEAVLHYVSPSVERVFSYRPGDLTGRAIMDVLHPEDLPLVIEAFAAFIERSAEAAEDGTTVVAGDEALRIACRVRAADGTWLPTESTISRYSRGRLLITTRDLSEQAALQRQVAHLTFHDGPTGLPNRAYFEERTRDVLDRRPGRGAVVFIDIDGFTAVNDSAGHAAGDQVLAQAARRLRSAVHADDTVARWGGDEFAVLVENPADAQSVVELAERLLRVLSQEPYRVGDRGIALTASVGLAFADHASSTGPAELIRNGDLAMARAKELGGGRVEIFAAHMHADVVRRLELGGDLQRALAEEQFAVEFQPVVELATSRVVGVEALLRWWRGSTLVPPEEFIGPAEESGLMIPLGNWILREACQEVARWRAGNGWDIGLSVNFTARQIAAPRFAESVAAVLAETGLAPEALTLEVKEEALVEDAGQNVERLSALRDLGVRLAIDDFGTGYASLAHLGRLPVDVIKIDPSFVAGLGRDETLSLLTRTIVRLGRDLGLAVVAEGIERPEQLELLREVGCPRGQGYLVARPMPPTRVEGLIRNTMARGAVPLQGSAL
jgi:diguanylate cyclase (GGDEF)-like protein/PAS domain S-box-containing protein